MAILGVHILNFNNFGGFQKDEYFLGVGWVGVRYDETVDILGGHRKTGLFLNILGFFPFFLRSRYRIEIFLGVANSVIFWGIPDTSDIFGETVDAWFKSTCKKT